MLRTTAMHARLTTKSRTWAVAMLLCSALTLLVACGGSDSDAPTPKAPSSGNNGLPDDASPSGDSKPSKPGSGAADASEGSEGDVAEAQERAAAAELAAMRYREPEDGEDALHVRFEGGIRAIVDSPDERVEVLAEMLGGVSRPLEFLVVAPGGANHEALLQMRGRPYDMHQALELIGLVPAAEDEKLRFRGDSMVPKGDPVALSVIWMADDGERYETPVSRWVYNSDTQTLLAPGPWMFSGSIEQYQPELERSLYLANQVSNVIGLWRDPSCVLDNPRPSGVQDMIFRVAPENHLMPKRYREVTLVLRPWHDAESGDAAQDQPE